MAPYIVLARKWRPQFFKEVVGQAHVITTLQNALSANRLAHAYLFSGSRGIGKTTVARILAKAVNCLATSPTSQIEPCNSCMNCKEIAAGRSIDVIEIDAASNRGIDEIRELRENVKFAPVSCKYKIYIIDEVHMLTTEAFNALLKTLEDPPVHVIFILATTERHKIPETILSRCQQFEFRRMSYFEIVDRLKEICQEERFSVSDQALELIARQSEGCLRDAEVTLDQLISYSNGDVSVEDVSSLLGLGSYNLFEQLVGALISRQSTEALKMLNTLSNKGADLTRLLNSLISHFLDLQRIKLHPEPKGLIDVSDSRLAELKLQADGISLQRLRLLVGLLMKTAKDIKQFGYEQVNLECGIIEICQIPDGLQLEEAIAKLSELQAKLEQMTTEDRGQETEKQVLGVRGQGLGEKEKDLPNTQHPTPEIPEISEINVIWNALLERLKHKEQRVFALIEYAKPIELKAEALLIGFSAQEVFFKEQLEKEENRQIVEAELSQILSKKIAISFLTSDKIKPKDIESEKTSTVSQQLLLLQREAMNNENVQLVLNVLGGEVVKVKEGKG